MVKRTVIYLPGIGDSRTILNWLQQAFLATWLMYGFSAKLFIMDWKSSEPYADRFDKLLTLIDNLHARGGEVALVGASAAASSVLLARMARPDVLIGAVTICGQIGGTAALHGPVAATHPRFKSSVALQQNAISTMTPDLRRRVMTLRPRQDSIVPPHEAVLPGATNYQMSLSGHMAGIGFGLLFEGYRIARFLKSLTASR
jgi:hypothetical protein